MYRTGRTGLYSARAQDCPQEMERNEAAPRHSWARQHAWLLLSFFPFPVVHPEHDHGTVCGFSMMEQVRLCAVWPTENWLGNSINHIQGWMTV